MIVSHDAVARCSVNSCETAPCDCGLVELHRVQEALDLLSDVLLNLVSEIEREIALDPRHSKEQVMGAHMLGALVRERMNR